MVRGSSSPLRAFFVGALCALLAFAPVHAAPGDTGSRSKAKPSALAPSASDLIDLPLDAPPELTPPPSVRLDKLETLDPKATKAKADVKAESPAEKPDDKTAKAKGDKAAKSDPKEPKPGSKAEDKAEGKAEPAARKKVPTADAPWLEKSKATLEVSSKTEGATVFFDGKELGKTPLEPVRVLPGTHELKLTKEGLADSARQVRLKPGGKLKVSIDLRPPPALAAGQTPAPLHVEVVDDEPKPEEDDSAPPPLITASGDLAGPGLKAAPAPQPAPAQALSTEAAPQTKPLVKQWWFWGAVAAGAVVLAAGVVYALPAQYAEKRDPTTACGGTCGVVVNK